MLVSACASKFQFNSYSSKALSDQFRSGNLADPSLFTCSCMPDLDTKLDIKILSVCFDSSSNSLVFSPYPHSMSLIPISSSAHKRNSSCCPVLPFIYIHLFAHSCTQKNDNMVTIMLLWLLVVTGTPVIAGPLPQIGVAFSNRRRLHGNWGNIALLIASISLPYRCLHHLRDGDNHKKGFTQRPSTNH